MLKVLKHTYTHADARILNVALMDLHPFLLTTDEATIKLHLELCVYVG